MGKYNYKMKWLMGRNQVLNSTDLKKLLLILGVKNFDEINIRDKGLKKLDTYKNFISHPYGFAERQTSKELRQILKHNKNAFYVEFVRT